MADRASHDVNLKTTLQAVSNLDNQTPVNLWADPTSHGLILSASNITLGDVVITDGTNTANVIAGTGGNGLLTGGVELSIPFTTTTVQAVASIDAGNYSGVSVQVTSQGTSSTVNFQVSNDNVNWISAGLYSTANFGLNLTGSTTGTGIFVGGLSARYFRLNITGISAGTTAGVVVFSTVPRNYPTQQTQSNQSGTWTVGSNSATGSAAPANAFFMGVTNGTNLIGINSSSANGDAYSGSGSVQASLDIYNGSTYDRMRSAGALGDGASNTGLLAQAGYIYNGASYDRMRTAAAASNTTGTGLLGAGSLAVARVALPTAVTATNYTTLMADKFGRQVVTPNTVRDLVGSQTTTITASTTETTVVTAAASTFNDLLAMWFSNTSATATRVDVRDTTAGTIIYSMYIPAGDMRGFTLTTPYPQTTVNTNWTVTCGTAITDLRVTALFAKNQ